MNKTNILRLIGNVTPDTILVKENQSTDDIIKRIVKKHENCKADYDKIALQFSGGSARQVCKKLFEFCKDNIEYYEEPVEDQYISAPSTILKRGYSDCKGYALFCAGVLDALKRKGMNLDWKFRFTSYDLFDPAPGHVFVVVTTPSDEIWLDPVLRDFDKRKFYWYKKERKVSGVAGIGCSCNSDNRFQGTMSGTAKKIGLGFYSAPPPDSRVITTSFPGYPQNLPQWVVTPDNRLMLAPTPFGRTLTDPEMKIVLSALQDILNRYTNYRYDVFSYVSPGGWTVAGEVNRVLKLKTGDFFLTGFGNDFFTAIPKNIDSNNKSGLGVVGDIFKTVLTFTPLGAVSMAVNLVTGAVNSATALKNQQTGYQTLQTIKNSPSPAGTIEPTTGTGFFNADNKWIWIAGGVVVILLLTSKKGKTKKRA